MKKHIISLALTFTLLNVNAQTIDSMNDNRLTPRQLSLAECACLEAQGDMEKLDNAIRKAFDNGVTVNELKESFSQLYAYTGFPRSLNALNKLKAVLDDRKAQGIADNEGKAWTRPEVWDNAGEALKRGTEVQTRLVGGKPYNYDFCPQDDYYLKSHLFGDIFASDQLSESDREIVTVAALSGMKGVEPQLASHKRGAVMMGNSQEQVDALCAWLDAEGLTLKSEFPKGDPNVNYAQYFKGDSYLAPIKPKNLSAEEKTVQGYSNVTFEPGCRNNWHIHHGAHQILICVSGKGWYQEWGKPAIPLKAGDVIDIPEGVKHWHGAQQDSWFQHLATHVKTSDAESNEWLEPVSDDHYRDITNDVR
ncbi:MAG: carboxymuconolactone decarboxylase family protein [Prevotella sp.]